MLLNLNTLFKPIINGTIPAIENIHPTPIEIKDIPAQVNATAKPTLILTYSSMKT